MEQKNSDHQTTTEEYIRMDLIWNENWDGDHHNTIQSIETGDMQHKIYHVGMACQEGRTSRSSHTRLTIITTMEDITEDEIREFEEESIKHMTSRSCENNPKDLEDPDEIHIGAIIVDENDELALQPVEPVLHIYIHGENHPRIVTPTSIEKLSKKEIGTRVDVQEAGEGFNVFVRESTITEEEAKEIEKHIYRGEDQPQNMVNTFYTAPTSEKLPCRNKNITY